MKALIANTLEKMLFKKARISKIERINDSFLYIEMSGEELKGASLGIGDFFQISFGSFKARSYSPIHWDAETGVLSFLYFSHGEGLAAAWFQQASSGDECLIYGPRKSMNPHSIKPKTVFIGDETTLGFAASIARAKFNTQDMRYFFEVTSLEDTAEILDRFKVAADISKTLPYQKILEEVSPESCVLVVGNAETVKKVRAEVNSLRNKSTVIGIPFWFPGREGK